MFSKAQQPQQTPSAKATTPFFKPEPVFKSLATEQQAVTERAPESVMRSPIVPSTSARFQTSPTFNAPLNFKHQTSNLPIQAKLTVGQPNDKYEQEADAMADKVVQRWAMPNAVAAMPTITHFNINAAQRACAACEKEDHDHIQRKESGDVISDFRFQIPSEIQRKGSGEMTASPSVESRLSATKGGGNPLPESTRTHMESAIGADFSNVRVHTGGEAVQLSQDLSAHAFTHGSDVYFNSGKFSPNTDSGRHLLAHELTHTVQQGNNGVQRMIQRRSYYTSINGLLAHSTATAPDYAAAYLILSPLNAVDMLDTLGELERRSPRMVLSLLANLNTATGPVGVVRLRMYFLGQKNARYQNEMSPSEMSDLATNIVTLPINQQQAIHTYITTHRTAVTQDLYASANLPSATQQANIETVFNPGATVTMVPVTSPSGVTTLTPVVTQPTPNVVCATNTALNVRIRTVLVPVIQSQAAAFRTLKASPPAFPISSANSMADLAQREIERYFGSFLARASRSGAAGAYRMGSTGGTVRASSLLGDQSTVTRWQTESGRMGWLRYWYKNQTGNLNDTLHCETAQIDAALLLMARDTSLRTDIDDYVNSWPAEATGGINIQPYQSGTNLICDRWDVFTTIIHEFIHILAHPNFVQARSALPNNALEILKEGVDDLLKKELWEGSGHLRTSLISAARASDRAIIEGGNFPLDLNKVCNHSYYDSLSAAESIAASVGLPNIKLAYFLGQTEYLGLGMGTNLGTGNLASSSFYNALHTNDVDFVTVIAGETREQLLLRTNGNQINDTANVVITPSTILPAVVRIPGVRHVYIHTDDSIISIAVQNGVTPYEIMRANNFTSNVLPAIGSRIIIPRH
jgi:Domain of unknown function (DUF4157)/LysM domain